MPRVPIPQNMVGIAEPTEARLRAPDTRGGIADAIASGLQDIGGAVMDAATVRARQEREEAVDADTAYSGWASRFQNDPDNGVFVKQGKDARDAYAPTIEALSKRRSDIAAGLKSPIAKREFGRMSQQRLDAYTAGIQRHVAQQDAVAQKESATAAIGSNSDDAISNFQNPDAQDVAIERVVHEYAALAHRDGLPDEVGVQNARHAVSGIRLASIQRYAEQSSAAADTYRQRYGAQVVGDDAAQADRVIRIAKDREEAETRRQEAEARATAAHAATLQREQLATVKAQLDTGAGTSADWVALATGYSAMGDTSAAAEARQRGVEVRAVEVHRGASPAVLDGLIGDLQAKPSLSVQDASTLKGLTTLRGQTAARLDQPGGALSQYQYATGIHVSALSPNDPTTYRARAGVAITAAQTYGRRTVEPLTQTEAQPLKDLVSGDSTQRLAALQTIAKFGDPRAIDGAARQIAGHDDGAFRVAATLSVLPGDAGFQAARDILRGPEATKTNGGVYLPQQAKLGFSTYASPALRGLSPDYAADVMDAARNLYTARMTTAGRTQWDDQAWRDSIDTALGAYRKDGVKYGGVVDYRGTPVSVPPGWTGDGVFRRLARATGKELTSASAGPAPVWPDGSPVYSGQLRDLTPVRVGGTRYGFMTRNARMLGAKGGGVYVLDVAKVPWR